MGTIDTIFEATIIMIGIAAVGFMIMVAGDIGDIYEANLQHEEDYGLGSVVTTTAEYEYMTNDTFTGAVVRGEGWSDLSLTLRNRDGVERRIATEFLEPME